MFLARSSPKESLTNGFCRLFHDSSRAKVSQMDDWSKIASHVNFPIGDDQAKSEANSAVPQGPLDILSQSGRRGFVPWVNYANGVEASSRIRGALVVAARTVLEWKLSLDQGHMASMCSDPGVEGSAMSKG